MSLRNGIGALVVEFAINELWIFSSSIISHGLLFAKSYGTSSKASCTSAYNFQKVLSLSDINRIGWLLWYPQTVDWSNILMCGICWLKNPECSHSDWRVMGILLHCWWECKLVQPLWRTVWGFLEKLEIELPYDPKIPLLGIHTKETRSERDMCTSMFIAALFIIHRTWKQPRCPLADEWIRKLWYIYTMGYYSAIKNNAFESVLMRWMKLEPIIQSEVSRKKNTNTVY